MPLHFCAKGYMRLLHSVSAGSKQAAGTHQLQGCEASQCCQL